MALQKEDGLQLTRRYTYLRGSREAINSPHGFADRYNIQRKLTSIKKCLLLADNRLPLIMCNAANIRLLSIMPNDSVAFFVGISESNRHLGQPYRM